MRTPAQIRDLLTIIRRTVKKRVDAVHTLNPNLAASLQKDLDAERQLTEELLAAVHDERLRNRTY